MTLGKAVSTTCTTTQGGDPPCPSALSYSYISAANPVVIYSGASIDSIFPHGFSLHHLRAPESRVGLIILLV